MPDGAPPAATELVHCSGGAPDPLQVEVFPERVDLKSGGEEVVFRIAFRPRFAAASTMRYATELVDDLGTPVLPLFLSPPIRLQGAAADRSFELRAGLADGYYQLRVTAAGVARGLEGSSIVSTYLRVTKGAVTTLSSDEWFARSRAKHAEAG